MVDRPLAPGMVDVAPAALSLFDQVPAVYAFWREHLFRDDTERIVSALWPGGRPPGGSVLLELGCGPGFYARRLASRFPDLRVVGIDRSAAQLRVARARLAAARLSNCRLDLGDAMALPYPDSSLDAVVSARLLAAVAGPGRVVAEAHRVLRPGGRLFIAEPRPSLRAALPLAMMRVAAQLGSPRRGRWRVDPDRFEVLDRAAFSSLLGAQTWTTSTTWADGSYQYALLEKGTAHR